MNSYNICNILLSSPLTNDNMQIYLWIFVAVCALGALISALVVNKRKIVNQMKEKEKEEQNESPDESISGKADIGDLSDNENSESEEPVDTEADETDETVE